MYFFTALAANVIISWQVQRESLKSRMLKLPEATSKGDVKNYFITDVILGHPVEGMYCLCMSILNGINRTDEPYKTTDWTRIELQTLLLLLLPEMNHFQLTKQTKNICLVQGWTKSTVSIKKEETLALCKTGP